MNYSEEYRRKVVPVDQAMKSINSGDLVHYGEFMMNSRYLDEALSRRSEELKRVQIRSTGCPFPPQGVLSDPQKRHFIYYDWHLSQIGRKLHTQGLCNYVPGTYHEGPSVVNRYLPVDVALIMVAPMDKHGFFNLGTSNSLTGSVIKNARTVIAEVNNSVPRCLGGSGESVHISEIDYLVEGDHQELMELPLASCTEVDKKVASLIMDHIPNGGCLQLGIGGMPNAIGAMIAQSDLKELGVHTEMLADSYVDMYEAGRISGIHKNLDRGKMVYTFAMGSRRLYEFLDDNPVCAIYPVDYTNDPYIIGQNDNVIAINNALEVDLFAQVASESAGVRQISGTGGQLDFIFGAFRSQGGKGFICLSSTYQDKQNQVHSRIKATLSPGTIVTLPRSLNYYVATEYGVALMKGKSIWERADALINIAHPSFRDQLVAEAEKLGIWTRSNQVS